MTYMTNIFAPAASSNQKTNCSLSVMLVMQKIMTDLTDIMAAPVSKKANTLLLRATCLVMTT